MWGGRVAGGRFRRYDFRLAACVNIEDAVV